MKIKILNILEQLLIIILILFLVSLGYFYGKLEVISKYFDIDKSELVDILLGFKQLPSLQNKLSEYLIIPDATSSAFLSSSTPKVISKSTKVQGDKTTTITDTQQSPEEWGVAKQLDEKTWTIKVGFDDRMATAEEILTALNEYRQRHGAGSLTWDDNLANYALLRAKYFNEIKKLDAHKGFEEYVNDPKNLQSLGFWGVGENSSIGYRLYGVHLIEWIFAGDEPHDLNQRNPQWSHIGIGVDGTAVDIIFGKNKI